MERRPGPAPRKGKVQRPTMLRPKQTTDVLCENPRPPGGFCRFEEACYYAHTAEEVALMRAWREARSLAEVRATGASWAGSLAAPPT